MTIVIPVDIVHGKLHIGRSHRTALQEAVLVWPDGPATLTLERRPPHAAGMRMPTTGASVKGLADYTGSTPDDMHDVLKIVFAEGRGDQNRVGEVVAEFVNGGSTRELTVTEFYDYVERIRQWAFEKLDVDLPPGIPAAGARPTRRVPQPDLSRRRRVREPGIHFGLARPARRQTQPTLAAAEDETPPKCPIRNRDGGWGLSRARVGMYSPSLQKHTSTRWSRARRSTSSTASACAGVAWTRRRATPRRSS